MKHRIAETIRCSVPCAGLPERLDVEDHGNIGEALKTASEAKYKEEEAKCMLEENPKRCGMLKI
jgi:hypothetical protein